LQLPLSFEDLKSFAEMAYSRVENKNLDFDQVSMGVLSHLTAPFSNSHSANVKHGRVVDPIDDSFIKIDDVWNDGLDLVIYSKHLTDRATKVVAGSKFSAESNWINAAVKLGNEALMAYKRTKTFPDYLDAFIFSSTDWQSKRTAVLSLLKLLTPHTLVFDSVMANGDKIASVRNYSGNARLPDGVTFRPKSSTVSQLVNSVQAREWSTEKKCVTRAAGSSAPSVEWTVDEVHKQISQGVQLELQSQCPFGKITKHECNEWFKLMGLDLSSADKSVVRIIDSNDNRSSTYLKNFFVVGYDFDEDDFAFDG
jgi:hypothetical protein